MAEKKLAGIKKSEATLEDTSSQLNIVLKPQEVAELLKQLRDAKLVVPLGESGSGRLRPPGSHVAFVSNGCCVDVNTTAVGPVSTIGVNKPIKEFSRVATKLNAKDVSIKICLPENMTIK